VVAGVGHLLDAALADVLQDLEHQRRVLLETVPDVLRQTLT
jgi:hypothetical protein